ncbi:hypothetical protein B296_00012309 [Ensete ventricosum]|uniref:Uncharacterized protein n=1 Tax=Ensete ventricosum TaxID=4639 RepID=A0A426ZRC9_ENSVE|nr:hypothetical protein B296_00012309 [Ensete ventricosum]
MVVQGVFDVKMSNSYSVIYMKTKEPNLRRPNTAHGNSNLAILYVLVPDGVSRSRVAKTIVLDPIHSLRRLTGSQLFLPSLLTDLGLLKP